MSEIKCNGCGRLTNTALCKWDWKKDGADFCYAALENNKWVKGCAPDIDLNKLDKYERLPYDFAKSIYEKEQ